VSCSTFVHFLPNQCPRQHFHTAPSTGKCPCAYNKLYVFHDTASQVTLISANSKSELGLKIVPDPSVNICTLTDYTVAIEGRTEILNWSLITPVKNLLFVTRLWYLSLLMTLTRSLTLLIQVPSALKHFDGAVVFAAPDWKQIDILIGQSDKQLLTVRDEREGVNPEEPNYMLTRLEPIASGGKAPAASSLSVLRVQVNFSADFECE